MNSKSTSRLQSSAAYSWLMILFASLFLFYRYVLQVSPSIMRNNLMRAFHVQAFGFSNLSATFFYSYTIMQIFAGVILDRFGPRLVAAIAILTAATGAYLFAEANSLMAAEFSRALMGVGIAFATANYMKIAAMWFRPSQFAFVGGSLTVAVMLGAVVGEAPLSSFVLHVGWRESLVYCAIVGYIIAGLFYITVRDNNAPLATHGTPLKVEKFAWSGVLEVVSSSQNWLLTLYSGLAFAPMVVFASLWGTSFLKEANQLSNTNAAWLDSIIFIGFGLGGPILGFISDYLKRRRVIMFFGLALSLFALLVTIYISMLPYLLLAVLLFLFGFGTGAFMLGFAVGKEINKLYLAATVIALINTGDAVFGAITQPLVGKFIDWGWQGQMLDKLHYFSVSDYHRAFLIMPIYLALAFIALLFVKEQAKP
ncbi:MAG: MFS transporter [Gammaproteobacteria bacterium]|nr:MFS transporter [Gammaproteobacteria bacterium]